MKLMLNGCEGSGQFGDGTYDYNTYRPMTELISNGVKDFFTHGSGNPLLILMEDGTVKISGSQGLSQLGLPEGTNIDYRKLYTYPLKGVKQVIGGKNSAVLFLMEDGTVKGCGGNYYGELGLGHSNPVYEIVDVPITNVKKIYHDHQCSIFFLKNDGTVWYCGYGYNNIFANGSDKKVLTITQQTQLSNVKELYLNKKYCVFALLNDGTVKAHGKDSLNKDYYPSLLGVGKRKPSNSTFITLPITNVKDITLNMFNTYLFTNDNRVYYAGPNFSGCSGLGHSNEVYNLTEIPLSRTHNIVKVATDYEMSAFLTDEGEVYGCGYVTDYYNAFGFGSLSDDYLYTPTKIDIPKCKDILILSYSAFFLLEDGTIKGRGENYTGQILPKPPDIIKTLTDLCVTNVISMYCTRNQASGNNIIILCEEDKKEIKIEGEEYFIKEMMFEEDYILALVKPRKYGILLNEL